MKYILSNITVQCKSKLIVNLLDCTNLFSPNTCEKNKKIIGNYS